MIDPGVKFDSLLKLYHALDSAVVVLNPPTNTSVFAPLIFNKSDCSVLIFAVRLTIELADIVLFEMIASVTRMGENPPIDDTFSAPIDAVPLENELNVEIVVPAGAAPYVNSFVDVS